MAFMLEKVGLPGTLRIDSQHIHSAKDFSRVH